MHLKLCHNLEFSVGIFMSKYLVICCTEGFPYFFFVLYTSKFWIKKTNNATKIKWQTVHRFKTIASVLEEIFVKLNRNAQI